MYKLQFYMNLIFQSKGGGVLGIHFILFYFKFRIVKWIGLSAQVFLTSLTFERFLDFAMSHRVFISNIFRRKTKNSNIPILLVWELRTKEILFYFYHFCKLERESLNQHFCRRQILKIMSLYRPPTFPGASSGGGQRGWLPHWYPPPSPQITDR